MKKIITLMVMVAIIGTLSFSAFAAPNPWQDSSVKVMEIESFTTGYPSGDLSQWKGFWSYNKESNFASAGGQVKDGQLVINSAGTDSLFFNRASGAIASSLLSQAEGIGFYIKNTTRGPAKVAFYGIGDKDKMAQGEAMIYFKGASATFIDMQGKSSALAASSDLVTIPAGAEGYVLFDFKDFVDGWHDNKKLDTSKTSLVSIGFRLSDAVVNVRYTVIFDQFFLYGKNVKHAPGTINMKTTPVTTTTTRAIGNITTTTSGSKSTDTTLSTEETLDGETTDLTELTDETTTTTSADKSVNATTFTKAETTKKGLSPAALIIIVAIILVLAAAAIVVLMLVKKNKENTIDTE